MDDDLVLNIATDDSVSIKAGLGKKGGRWTERLKEKRTLKRKSRTEEKSTPSVLVSKSSENDRPSKKARIESAQPKSTAQVPTVQPNSSKQARAAQPVQPSRPTQIISSLFSYNPKVDAPAPRPIEPSKITAPSNAPLDSSTFSGLGLNPLLISHLSSKMDIHKPTAIQRASLPALLSTLPEKSSRDVFLQSQTGSGKTLSYLLPIIQDLLPLSSLSYIDRSIGTLAIIIAPTRELAKQISDVLEAILKMRLRAEDSSTTSPDTSTQLTRWLVSGLLVGGATRTHEKARLRKGLPILVSTPGRLLDHLQNTSSFNVGKCRWLVLDEADQLMELGFEETITGIIQGLDGRRRMAKQAMEEGKTNEVGGWDWERRRRTILCSATIREDVQKLAGTALSNPLMVKATEFDKDENVNTTSSNPEKSLVIGSNPETFTPPSQLSQKYVTVPLKLRLVSLIALLRKLVAETQVRRGAKIIVFLSCTDSVDFHWNLLAGSSMAGPEPHSLAGKDDDESDESSEDGDVKSTSKVYPDKVEAQCSLLPDVTVFRLHGSLPNNLRLAALKGFTGSQGKKNKPAQENSSILFCTSVAARGLDLPLVRAVVQYDLPTEGGVTEYVHRVGRTARAGKGGEAWAFVAPSEVEWVKWAENKMQGEETGDSSKVSLIGVAVEDLLRSGFGGRGSEYEQRSTEVQLAFERWVLQNKENALMARKAFLSHMRAYATHPSSEKHIFHIRNLHMGHLAKAFALRDAPKSVKVAHAPSQKKNDAQTKTHRASNKAKTEGVKDWEKSHSGEAEKRMQAIVRAQGRLIKQGGVMASMGASEFQISGGYDLEKLVGR
ncbi:ATP-dependent RNA helicase DBP7 [Psilocybe cubensis]|uniref:ATP-dependent RNA helicase DBP7 n=2 Tax=Psilocybe cubensis TaxID=181762 RepID=A0ACB8HCB5_PSICU|nr:ATP-dependent RNA helicase DBP7 [Psilocybe cubensis]KAH9485111.1 ATP-dependent RNA helicase DBP7 [Psilocybe cubensis]